MAVAIRVCQENRQVALVVLPEASVVLNEASSMASLNVRLQTARADVLAGGGQEEIGHTTRARVWQEGCWRGHPS